MNENDADRKSLEAFVLDNPELEQLESRLSQFNIFEAIGAIRQELRHSDFLAFLLNPAENHGLGALFLKRLLMRALSNFESPPFSLVEIDVTGLDDAIVMREWQNIDILIVDDSFPLAVAIENKVFTGEHDSQLSRYRDTIEQQYPDHHKVYIFLTPDEIIPEDEEDRLVYIPISYGTVAEVMDALLKAHSSTLARDVATLIGHYTAMLRRHIVTDSEIAELCRKIYFRHRKALDLIFEHKPDLHQEIATYLELKMNQQGIFKELYWSKSHMRFMPANWEQIPLLKDGLLAFQFDNTYYLRLKLTINPGIEYVRRAILEKALEHKSTFKGVNARITNKYKSIYSSPWYHYSDVDDPALEDVQAQLDQKWDTFLTHELPAIRKIVEEEIPWTQLEIAVSTTIQ